MESEGENDETVCLHSTRRRKTLGCCDKDFQIQSSLPEYSSVAFTKECPVSSSSLAEENPYITYVRVEVVSEDLRVLARIRTAAVDRAGSIDVWICW